MVDRERKRIGYVEQGVGLRCQTCGSRSFAVVDTERLDGAIRRRRECRHCGRRVTTMESQVD